VTGFIETDGSLGILHAGDITGWNLLLNDGTNTPVDLASPLVGGVFDSASDLSATSTQLLFNFSDTSYFFFKGPENYIAVCFSGSGVDCLESVGAGVSGVSLDVLNPAGNTQFTIMSGIQAIASTNLSDTPETATFALLCAGVLLFRFRQQRTHVPGVN
jgi:hypothetical protein